MKNTPTFKELIKNPVHLLAFGFGSGLAPKAPGTFGTMVAIPFYCLLSNLPLTQYLLVVFVSALVGIYLCGKTASDMGVHDHGGIVWDEIVGYWITMAAIPFSWINVLLGFVLFRLFDIVKPPPIKWLDQKIKGGFGIMVDDIIAALFAWALLYSANAFLL